MRRLAVLAVAAVLVGAGGCFGPAVPPIAGFTACLNGWQGLLEMQFNSTSSTIGNHWITLYSWDFGDGETADDYGGWVSHIYAEEGTYTVRLTVTDDRGLTASTEQSLEIAYPAVIGDDVVASGAPSRAVGEVDNRSGFFLLSVTIKVKFYDADGVRIGEGTTNVTEIDAGERVRFTVEGPSYPDVVASVRASVTAYVTECSGTYPVPVGGKP
ncbi:MAG: PKD domain-containing protein [Candidatus Bipolaricaulis sp.]|nr:PKD domain-containing protein [Candidatus Bipolaricaulis sp.]